MLGNSGRSDLIEASMHVAVVEMLCHYMMCESEYVVQPKAAEVPRRRQKKREAAQLLDRQGTSSMLTKNARNALW